MSRCPLAVVGSVNLDRLIRVRTTPAPGSTTIARGYDEQPGGKGGNQALAASRRTGTALIAATGADAAAAQALTHLRDQVELELQEHPGTPTGQAFITVTEDGENTIVVVAGANRQLAPSFVVDALERWQPRAVLTQLEIAADVVGAAAGWASAAGARFALNASPIRPLDAELLRQCDPLIVNLSEAAALSALLSNGDAAAKAAGSAARAASALARYCRSAVVTAGAAGAAFAAGPDVLTLPARRVEPVDTTGAGDCFAGTLLAELVSGEPPDRALAAALTAATEAVLQPGAQQ